MLSVPLKKILILAYDYPPNPSVGAQRPAAWMRYLPGHGLQPVVVTRHWEPPFRQASDTLRPASGPICREEDARGAVTVRVPFRPNLRDRLILRFGTSRLDGLRKALSFFYAIAPFFSSFFDEKAGIYRAAEELIRKEAPALIIATGEPFVLFRYAAKLSKKYGIPWVADYRDAWSLNYSMRHSGRGRRWLYQYLYPPIERSVVRSAASVMTVSPALCRELGDFLGRELHLLPNGFPEEIADIPPEARDPQAPFTLAYAGSLYDHQRVEVFLAGLRDFLLDKELAADELKVFFYGLNFNPRQRDRVRNFDPALRPYLHLSDRMPYARLIAKLKNADLLLLFANEAIDGSCMKVYDYIALGKPVLLAVNDHGSMEALLKETGNAFLCDDAEDVKRALSEAFEEFRKNGRLKSTALHTGKYSRENSVRQLAKIIAELCAE